MKINHETENKNLVECINLLEEIKGESKLSEEHEEKLNELKKEAGLILTAEVRFLGLKNGFYLFESAMSNGTSKYFKCNPDDIDFYNLCIPKALELDQNPAMRKRRLEEYKKGENLKSSVSTVEEAIEKISENKQYFTQPSSTSQTSEK